MKRHKNYNLKERVYDTNYYNSLVKKKVDAGTATDAEKAFVKRGYKSWHQKKDRTGKVDVQSLT